MTGFARTMIEQEWGTATWEMRSVNHRYLELNFRLPDNFRSIELNLRERVHHYIKRGKVECTLKYQLASLSSSSISLNTELIQQLAAARKTISSIWSDLAAPNAINVLSWPGVIIAQEPAMDTIYQVITENFEEALSQLADTRQREGASLELFIEERLNAILTIVQKIEQRMPLVVEHFRTKLYSRVQELKADVNIDRFEQELLLFMQRIDIAEEMSRLQMHIQEVHRILQKDGAVGRQLDFLSQELNREANTLGAKSMDAEITHAVVDIKVLIEQIREQVQNIE